MVGIPLAYFITFRTYGTWLPGNKKGHVNRFENCYQTPYPQGTSELQRFSERLLKTDPFIMSEPTRKLALQTVVEHCQLNNWDLHAVQIRTNHIHLLVTTDTPPEIVLKKLKVACTTKINLAENKKIPRWSRHGSTRYIFKEKNFYGALNYLVHEQGEKMEIYVSNVWRGILWN